MMVFLCNLHLKHSVKTYKVKVVQEVHTIIEYEIEADNEEQAKDKVYGLDPSEGNEVWDDLTYFNILDIEEVNNSQQELEENEKYSNT